MDLVTLFYEIDDFCVRMTPGLHAHLLPMRQRERESRMHLSEVMTILVWFHIVGYRNFKQFYRHEVSEQLGAEFPHLVRYNRFVELRRDALLPLCIYLSTAICSAILSPIAYSWRPTRPSLGIRPHDLLVPIVL